jgi:DNA topoisomerase-1
MGKPLVIVESPTKQKMIQKFLGDAYVVEASVGHIRDLPRKSGDVPPEAKAQGFGDLGIHIQDDFKPWYVVSERAEPNIKKLRGLMKDTTELLLATDEDREGESISWHLVEVLKPRVPVKRLVFHEITPEAIRHALTHPRAIDANVVAAQETRRVIDRLYGYGVSPVLWRKLGRSVPSAGRVQSPAVRLLVDRERARMAFVSGTWWDIEATLAVAAGAFSAQLMDVGGKRIAKGRDFDETTGALASRDVLLLDEAAARALVARLQGQSGQVVSVETRPWTENPPPPFTTSTLQQEANRKLRWGAKRTMDVAQRLYQNGWITYMRTDSTNLSDQAIQAARSLIAAQYGPTFLPAQPRRYSSRANAQEAHEAIRPAGNAFRSIEDARRELDFDEGKLYELVWKRAVASQMASATGDALSVVIAVQDARFGASGRTIRFPGFQRAYVEGSDDPEAELADRERILPAMSRGEAAEVRALTPKGHQTQPPARYTDASLVKELEKLGIGRPSTYASILELITGERGYAFHRGNALVPTHKGFLLVGFMEQALAELVDYDFTKHLEDELDNISSGSVARSSVLKRFYHGAEGLEQRLQEALAADATGVYRLPLAGAPDGELHVRVGQFGAYVTDGEKTANIPPEMAPDEVDAAWARAQIARKAEGPASLGRDPATGDDIYLMDGRFGAYVQRGQVAPGSKEKPPRASLPKGMVPGEVTLELAIGLLALPRTLGTHDGNAVLAFDGRYGPYIRCGEETRSLPAGGSPLTVTLEEAVALLAAPRERPGRAPRASVAPLREFGADPVSGGTVKLMSGRFGPYVTDGTTNATLPKGTSPETVTVDRALELLATKRAAGPGKKPARRGGRPAAPRSGPPDTTARTVRASRSASASGTKAPTTRKAGAKKPAGKKKP